MARQRTTTRATRRRGPPKTKRQRPQAQRSDKALRLADKRKRIARIEELIASRYSNVEIVRLIEKEFEVAERTAYDDLKEAYERWAASDDLEREHRLDVARRAWERRYRRCEERGEESAANYALDKLCKLDGLYAPKKVDVSGTVAVTVSMRAVMAVLDAEGIAAFETVLRQVEAAKARGELPDPETTKAPAIGAAALFAGGNAG
jgi:hypothetical protein